MRRILCTALLVGLAACAREPAGPLESTTDLSVERFRMSPLTPVSGEGLLLQATVVNRGTEIVVDATVSFYLDADTNSVFSPSEAVDESVMVAILVPADSAVVSARVDSLPEGAHTFRVALDAADDDSTNNQVDGVVQVVGRDQVRVHVINVGQGDAVLVSYPEGVHVLVDGGDVDSGSEVVEYLLSNDVNHLDLVVVTHLDRDHYGGLTAVLTSEISVDRVWRSCGRTSGGADLADFESAVANLVENAGLDTLTVAQGVSLEALQDGVFDVVHPAQVPAEACDDSDDRNNQSVVCRVTYGGFRFLLTADVMEDAEADLVARAVDMASEVVKVPHHGAATSSTQAFVDAVGASAAIVSVGAENSFGHPDDTALQRWDEAGAAVYRTDRDGSLLISSDGDCDTEPCFQVLSVGGEGS